jgi:flagellar biosynthesis/type III secretory pathway protein FliH
MDNQELKNNAHAIMNADTEYDAQEMLKNAIKKEKEKAYQEGLEEGKRINLAKTYKSSEAYAQGFKDGVNSAKDLIKEVNNTK